MPMYEPFRLAMVSIVREIATKVIRIGPGECLQLIDQSMVISLCNNMDELRNFLGEINRVFDIELEEDQAMLLMTIESFLDMLWLEVERALWYPGRSPRAEEDDSDEKSGEAEEDDDNEGSGEAEEESDTERQGLTIHVPPSLAAQVKTVEDVLAIGRLLCPPHASNGSATGAPEGTRLTDEEIRGLTNEEILRHVIAVAAEIFAVQAERIGGDTRLRELLQDDGSVLEGVDDDSLLFDFALRLEAFFDIMIFGGDISNRSDDDGPLEALPEDLGDDELARIWLGDLRTAADIVAQKLEPRLRISE